MTREEAIIILQESLRQNKVIQESPNTFFRSADIADGMKNAERRIEALNIATVALRAQPDTPPNDPLTPEGGYSHEVVHCKDCVNLYFKDFSAFCSHRVSACRPEGFCEYGERRRPEAGS